jgi:RecB family exonuclease
MAKKTTKKKTAKKTTKKKSAVSKGTKKKTRRKKVVKKEVVKVKVKRKKAVKKEESQIIIAQNEHGIIPSIKLNCIGVHKLQDAYTCNRMYFWKWILNLIPKKLNMAFWFGSTMHKSFEILPTVMQLSTDKALKKIYKGMTSESKKASLRQTIDVNAREEMDIQFKIGQLLIRVYLDLYKEEFNAINILGTEKRFCKVLDRSPVDFIGTVDAWGEDKNGALTLLEYKTASRITADYFFRLKFDKQVNGYAIGLKELIGKYPQKCPYKVFRKPSIRPKVNETVPQYLDRLEEDLYQRADWYFLEEPLKFGKSSIRQVEHDIEAGTYDLHQKYEEYSDDELLNPCNWSRNDRACFNYGTCPYFLLCRNIQSYKLYLRFYMARDIRYPQEQTELCESRALPIESTKKQISEGNKGLKKLRAKVRKGKK